MTAAGSAGARLLSAGSLVRRGAVFADVGTDHGYLPIALLRDGVIRRAILTDLREGPLSAAKENVAAAGLSGQVQFFLTDGAAALGVNVTPLIAGLGVTDLAICGMGGELIAAILSRAPFLKDARVRLILQPMTRAAFLRRYLLENGFAIEEEICSLEAGKAYICLAASYCGEAIGCDDLYAEFGALLSRRPATEAESAYIRARLCALDRARAGKIRGGESAAYEERVLAAARARLGGS